MKMNTFKLPNSLITDASLSLSARKVGAILFAHRNAFGYCKKSYEELARLADAAPATVRKAVSELTAAGYISSGHTYRYLHGKQMIVRGKNIYSCNLRFHGGYTLIPREMLRSREITPGAFCVCLYLCQQAGSHRRAFPSISRIAGGLSIARSTVCCALQQVKQLAGFLVQLCHKATGAFAASSYYLVAVKSNYSAQTVPVMATSDSPTPYQPLHSFILRFLNELRKCFSSRGVVRFLANVVKT